MNSLASNSGSRRQGKDFDRPKGEGMSTESLEKGV